MDEQGMDRKRVARVGAAVLASAALGAAVVAMGMTYSQEHDVPAVPRAVAEIAPLDAASMARTRTAPAPQPIPPAAPESAAAPATIPAAGEGSAHPAVVEGAREIMELEPLLIDILDQQ